MKNGKNATYNKASNCGNMANKATNSGMNYNTTNSTYDETTDCGNCDHCGKK